MNNGIKILKGVNGGLIRNRNSTMLLNLGSGDTDVDKYRMGRVVLNALVFWGGVVVTKGV